MRTVFINLKDKFFSPNCRRKNIENLVIFLVGVIIVIITGSYIFGNNEDKKVAETSANNIFDAELFENKLAKILSEIKGAGNVKVMVSYHTGIETVPLSDTKDSNTITEENDTGRVRKTEQSSVETSVIFNQEKTGNKVPYISKTIMPVVEGVIVTCDGGGDETVKANMIKAVTVITGVSEDKVQVFPKKNK